MEKDSRVGERSRDLRKVIKIKSYLSDTRVMEIAVSFYLLVVNGQKRESKA